MPVVLMALLAALGALSCCAFLMPSTGFSFISSERIDLRVVLGLAIGSIPAVLLAAFVVKELDVVYLRWALCSSALCGGAIIACVTGWWETRGPDLINPAA
jgi:uncharacterized membrane protein YfcA